MTDDDPWPRLLLHAEVTAWIGVVVLAVGLVAVAYDGAISAAFGVGVGWVMTAWVAVRLRRMRINREARR